MDWCSQFCKCLVEFSIEDIWSWLVFGEVFDDPCHPVTYFMSVQLVDFFLSKFTHFISKDTNRLKGKGWEKAFHGNSNQKGAGRV